MQPSRASDHSSRQAPAALEVRLPPPGLLAAGAALALAVGWPTFAGGGFSDSSRAVFVALAGLALALAAQPVADRRPGVGGAARAPVVLALTALGVLSLVSAIWTIALASAAIRWGLVILAYAAVAVVAAKLTARAGPWPFAVGLLVIAAVEAILGLQAVFRQALPDAESIYGHWRPGGTFEYQPALALLEVSAIPVAVAVAAALLVGAGATLAIGAPSPTTHHLSRHGDGARHPAARRGSSLLHGRGHEWLAAIETWEDRPLLGSGTGSYLETSVAHQGIAVSLYAHDLPLEEAAELGVLGFLLALWLYAGAGRALWRARAQPLALALLGPTCALYLISNLFDWTWHLAGLGAIWAAATGVLLAAGAARGDPPRKPPADTPRAG